MNYWADRWDLDEQQCPCDVHFNDWVAGGDLANKTFFHFGTGNHHVVGIRQAQNGSGNRVIAITASIDEYKSYIKLVTRNPRIAPSYLAYFGDIYLTHPLLLPDFDAVTLFHLCEFYCEDNNRNGGLNDRQLLDLMTDKTRIGGHLLFYTGSFAYEQASKVIQVWGRNRSVRMIGRFKSLEIYQKVA